MYALILITVLSMTETVVADHKGLYSTMDSCFDARDDILVEKEAYAGFFNDGSQAVCIYLSQK